MTVSETDSRPTKASSHLETVPIRVHSIQIDGLEKTKPDLLESLLAPCLHARSLVELKASLSLAYARINRLDIFKDISILLDRPDFSSSSDDKDSNNDAVLIRIKVEEKRFRINLGTELSGRGNDVSLNGGAHICNVLGRAEAIDLTATYGTHSSVPLSLAFTKPINGDPDRILLVSLKNVIAREQDFKPFTENVRGATIGYKVGIDKGTHEVKYAIDWRELGNIPSGASPLVRMEAGHSLKSAVSYIWSRCTRNDSVLPTNGAFIKIGHEIAGIGGNVQFFKTDLFFQRHFPIWRSLAISGSLRSGCVVSPKGQNSVGILDRYQLGGSNSVRGFVANGLGPRDRNASLGGDLLFEGGLALSFPLSNSTAHMLRAHLFTNFGHLSSINYQRPSLDSVKALWMDKNVSLGAGIAVKIGGTTRLELNACVPLVAQPSARPHKGLQLNLGLEWL